jgi:DNA-binding transcriptional MocR family regulator
VAPVLAELAVRLVLDGTAGRQVLRQREEAAQRQAQAARELAGLPFISRPTSPLLWLPLPPPWRADAFAAEARQRGVRVGPAAIFHAGRGDAPHAVRLGLGGASGETLSVALATLADLARSSPEDSLRIV